MSIVTDVWLTIDNEPVAKSPAIWCRTDDGVVHAVCYLQRPRWMTDKALRKILKTIKVMNTPGTLTVLEECLTARDTKQEDDRTRPAMVLREITT